MFRQNRPTFLRKVTFREVTAAFCNRQRKTEKAGTPQKALVMGTDGLDETAHFSVYLSPAIELRHPKGCPVHNDIKSREGAYFPPYTASQWLARRRKMLPYSVLENGSSDTEKVAKNFIGLNMNASVSTKLFSTSLFQL